MKFQHKKLTMINIHWWRYSFGLHEIVEWFGFAISILLKKKKTIFAGKLVRNQSLGFKPWKVFDKAIFCAAWLTYEGIQITKKYKNGIADRKKVLAFVFECLWYSKTVSFRLQILFHPSDFEIYDNLNHKIIFRYNL